MRNKTAEKSSSSRLCLSTTVVTVIALWVSTAQAADSSRGRVEYHLPIDEHRRERQQQQQHQQQRECEAGDASCQQQQQPQQQQQQQGIKQTQNHTGRGTPTTTAGSHTNNNNNNELKQASKESDDGIADTDYFLDDDDEEDGPVLLKWLNEKMVPDVKACGVYLAPSTIPGAGLGVRILYLDSCVSVSYWRAGFRTGCVPGS